MSIAYNSVAVHPIALLGAVDHFQRIYKGQDVTNERVVGVLLGNVQNGVLHCMSSFAVPFHEEPSKGLWFLDLTYVQSMLDLMLKINSRETVVGWYATGGKLRANDVEIHKLFFKFTPNPCFVSVDVAAKDSAPFTSYVFAEVAAADTGALTLDLQPIPSSVDLIEMEDVGVEHLLRDVYEPEVDGEVTKGSGAASGAAGQSTAPVVGGGAAGGAAGGNRVNLQTQLNAIAALSSRLTTVAQYLRDVSDGSLPPLPPPLNALLHTLSNKLPSVRSIARGPGSTALVNDCTAASMLGVLVRTVTTLHDRVENKITLHDNALRKYEAELLASITAAQTATASSLWAPIEAQDKAMKARDVAASPGAKTAIGGVSAAAASSAVASSPTAALARGAMGESGSPTTAGGDGERTVIRPSVWRPKPEASLLEDPSLRKEKGAPARKGVAAAGAAASGATASPTTVAGSRRGAGGAGAGAGAAQVEDPLEAAAQLASQVAVLSSRLRQLGLRIAPLYGRSYDLGPADVRAEKEAAAAAADADGHDGDVAMSAGRVGVGAVTVGGVGGAHGSSGGVFLAAPVRTTEQAAKAGPPLPPGTSDLLLVHGLSAAALQHTDLFSVLSHQVKGFSWGAPAVADKVREQLHTYKDVYVSRIFVPAIVQQRDSAAAAQVRAFRSGAAKTGTAVSKPAAKGAAAGGGAAGGAAAGDKKGGGKISAAAVAADAAAKGAGAQTRHTRERAVESYTRYLTAIERARPREDEASGEGKAPSASIARTASTLMNVSNDGFSRQASIARTASAAALEAAGGGALDRLPTPPGWVGDDVALAAFADYEEVVVHIFRADVDESFTRDEALTRVDSTDRLALEGAPATPTAAVGAGRGWERMARTAIGVPWWCVYRPLTTLSDKLGQSAFASKETKQRVVEVPPENVRQIFVAHVAPDRWFSVVPMNHVDDSKRKKKEASAPAAAGAGNTASA